MIFMKYISRVAEATLQTYLNTFSVVGITGPRQSGKSTLLLNQLKNYTYVTFDDPKIVDFFKHDPEGFMSRFNNRVIFDEVQYVPDIFRYIKISVDKDRQNYGKFVITGSSQFAFLKNVSESLAGRIGLLSLLPFQLSEMPPDLIQQSIYKGSYPELVDQMYRNHELWYAAYFDTYLTKDVRTLSDIGDIRDFRRFIALLASNASQTLNLSSYAKKLSISATTIKRWISVLEASYIIFLLQPYHNNFGKRIVKSPKIYFYDTGIISYFTGITNEALYNQGPMSGAIFENYIISEIYKRELHNKTNTDLFFLRTNNGLEIDLIIDRKHSKEFIEIKKTSTASIKAFKTINQLADQKDTSYLIYNGEYFKFAENRIAINYKTYLT